MNSSPAADGGQVYKFGTDVTEDEIELVVAGLVDELAAAARKHRVTISIHVMPYESDDAVEAPVTPTPVPEAP